MTPHDLETAIGPYCVPQTGPGGPFQAVTGEGVRIVAERLRLSPVKVMTTCLERDIWPLRFARNRGVLDATAQCRLLQAHAAIIGCGGLGGHAATLLARVGVGAFTLCDPDNFTESNLNRQLLCRENTMGRNKAQVTGEELAAIASHTAIRVRPVAARPENLAEILNGADIVMDCLDSLRARRHVAAAAEKAGIPLVYGAIAGDEGFAMLVRPGDRAIQNLCGEPGGEENATAEAMMGVPTVTPAATAAVQATLAIRFLAGMRQPDSRLHHLDLAVPALETLVL